MKVTVVTPVFNEEDHIIPFIESHIGQEGLGEIILVDGGSTDNSIKVLESIEYPQVRVLQSNKGRANQMNQGAKLANYETLLFLHVDSYLPADGLLLIDECMKDVCANAGSFYLTFDYSHPLLKLYSMFSRINASLFTYGDQGLFISKDAFDKIGGFSNIPIMEDLEIQKRIRKSFLFHKINRPVQTSSRRFLKHGILFNELKNILLVSLFLLGVSPERIARLY